MKTTLNIIAFMLIAILSDAQTVYSWSGYASTGSPTYRGRTFTRDGYTYTTTPAGGTTMSARVSRVGGTGCSDVYDGGGGGWLVQTTECFSTGGVLAGDCPPDGGTFAIAGLMLGNDWQDRNTYNLVEITFTEPVCCPVTFSIYDINTNSNFTDDILISATNQSGSTFYPSSISGLAAPYAYNAATGNIYNTTPTVTGGNENGSVTVNFASGNIKTIRFIYRSNAIIPSGSNPSWQYIIFGDITAGPYLDVPPASYCLPGSASLNATNGFTSYSWNPGGLSGDPVTVSPVVTTTYTVTASTATCTLTDQVTVTVSPSLNLVASGGTTICVGESATLTATGDGSPTYSWNNGAGAGSPVTVSPGSTTTYTVTATAGCTATANVTVTVNSATATASAIQTYLCTGGSTTLTATGGGTYSWDNGPTTASQIVTPSGTTTYTVTVTAPNTCTATANVTVGIADYGSLVPVMESTCDPSNINFATAPSVLGATSYTFTWYEVSGIQDPCPSSAAGMTQVMQETLSFVKVPLYQNNFDAFTVGAIGAGSNGWKEFLVTANATNRWAFGVVDGDVCLNMYNGTTYGNYSNGTTNEIAYINTPLNCTGYLSIVLSFDWKSLGNASDYGNLVYTTDLTGTSGWTNIGGQYRGQSAWQNVVDLDVSAQFLNQTVLLGFRWTCNAFTLNQPSFCVDNLILSGTTPPVSSYDPPGPLTSDMTYIAVVTPIGGTCNNISALADFCSQVTMDCPVPITLVSFVGNTIGDFNLLQWITASESNNDYFVLERSIDGIAFIPIGIINGAGNSNEILHYNFEDQFAPKNVYYRLKQIDYDGSYSYSDIIFLGENLFSAEEVSIWPNPATNELNIYCYVNCNKEVQILIYDQLGRIVMQKDFDFLNSGSIRTIDISKLDNGVYFIHVRNENFNNKYRVLKQ